MAKTEKKAEPEKKSVVKAKSRGRKYQRAKSKIDKNKKYSVEEAIKVLKEIKYANFDETVELHLKVDKAGLRGEVQFPYSIGKRVWVRIADDKLFKELEQGKINFDVLITHPSYMPKLARYAKILGPKGLMPNPKTGTISEKPEEVAKKFEKGTVRWKTEPKFPLIHQIVGKLSAKDEELVANVKAFLKSVGKSHIISVFIKSTMSPSLKLDTNLLY